jgi:hypothetical protein
VGYLVMLELTVQAHDKNLPRSLGDLDKFQVCDGLVLCHHRYHLEDTTLTGTCQDPSERFPKDGATLTFTGQPGLSVLNPQDGGLLLW